MRERLYLAARTAMTNSHCPYSDFPVGASVLTSSGKIYSGCNVENASYPEGWCAETSAIAQMVTAGENEIVEILVVAQKQSRSTPCGGCRQRLAEFATPDTQVHLCDNNGIVETVALGALLPAGFKLDA